MSETSVGFPTRITPDLGNTLHWNNSSNVLCNYTEKQEYLNMVLKTRLSFLDM